MSKGANYSRAIWDVMNTPPLIRRWGVNGQPSDTRASGADCSAIGVTVIGHGIWHLVTAVNEHENRK